MWGISFAVGKRLSLNMCKTASDQHREDLPCFRQHHCLFGRFMRTITAMAVRVGGPFQALEVSPAHPLKFPQSIFTAEAIL